MAVEPVVLGYNARVRLNGILFRVTGGNMELVFDEHEVGDSETGRAKTHLRGRYVLQGGLNFFARTDVDVHGASFKLANMDDEEVSLEVFHKGIEQDGYVCPSFTVFGLRWDWEVAGEVRGSFSNGKSNGEITMPGA